MSEEQNANAKLALVNGIDAGQRGIDRGRGKLHSAANSRGILAGSRNGGTVYAQSRARRTRLCGKAAGRTGDRRVVTDHTARPLA